MDASIAEFAVKLRSFGLWTINGHEQLWAAYYVTRPQGEPNTCGPRLSSDTWEQPHWQITFHDRLADVRGYPFEIACGMDQDSGMTGAPNRVAAERHVSNGFIYLCDFNGITRNQGRWIPLDAPKWRFENRIQNIIGSPDPHGVIREVGSIECSNAIESHNQRFRGGGYGRMMLANQWLQRSNVLLLNEL